MTVEIIPDPLLQVGWSPADAWTLQLPSPYVGSARLDQLFDSGTQVNAATLLADRLLDGFSPLYPADSAYLKQAIGVWLVKRFAQVETNSFLISSLAENYGDAAVGRCCKPFSPPPTSA